jgi:hypothetical protein
LKINDGIHPTIESILLPYHEIIGKDFEAYRNHVYRIFNFAGILDPDFEKNQETYAIAAALHDIGIWTHNTFDYLEPSIALGKQYLHETDQQHLEQEIVLMIDMHHKMSAYTGKYSNTVETFRQTDCIDVSMGVIKFELTRKDYWNIRKTFPTRGFHWFLIKQTVKRFLRHPFDPLPMFKK